MKRINLKSSFSVVEILIVIGIITLTTSTLFQAVKLLEPQKKARDLKRITDIRSMQVIVLQYLADGGEPLCPDSCNSLSAGRVKIQPCDNNWTGVNLCNYTNVIPVDPLNDTEEVVVASSDNGVVFPISQVKSKMYYYLRTSSDGYKIGAFQESEENISLVTNDGGIYPWLAEVGFNINERDQFKFTSAVGIPTPVPVTIVPTTIVPSGVLPSIYPTTLPKICPLRARGDANCDDRIDFIDFEIWRREYKKELNTLQTDFSKNEMVDLTDFEIWRKSFLDMYQSIRIL